MKNLVEINRNGDKAEYGVNESGYRIVDFIELESNRTLSTSEKLELIKNRYDLEDEDEYSWLKENSDFVGQLGKALIIYIKGSGTLYTREEMQKLDELIEQKLRDRTNSYPFLKLLF